MNPGQFTTGSYVLTTLTFTNVVITGARSNSSTSIPGAGTAGFHRVEVKL
jgi:hypothetical protein